MIDPGRHTATIEGDVVVFLIGARLHRLRAALQMRRIGAQMTQMPGRHSAQTPELGCLHTQLRSGAPPSRCSTGDFASLERFAKRTCRIWSLGGSSTDWSATARTSNVAGRDVRVVGGMVSRRCT